MVRKYVVLLVLVLTFVLASCSAPASTVTASAPPASESPSAVSAPSAEVTPSPAESPSVSVPPADDQAIMAVLADPRSNGFGALPIDKPKLSSADKKKFNEDKSPDYLLNGCSSFDGFLYIQKAELKDGKLYISIGYDIYTDADEAYKYMKKTFSFSDKKLVGLDMFSDDDCSIHDGKMYTSRAWKDKKSGSSEPVVGMGSNFIEIKYVDYAPMPVADDAEILIYNFDTNKAEKMTTKQFSDYLLKGQTSTEDIDDSYNFWFKYSDGVITGIAEDYAE